MKNHIHPFIHHLEQQRYPQQLLPLCPDTIVWESVTVATTRFGSNSPRAAHCCQHIWLVYHSGNALHFCPRSRFSAGYVPGLLQGQSFPWLGARRLVMHGNTMKKERINGWQGETMLSLPFFYLLIVFLTQFRYSGTGTRKSISQQ